MEFNILPLLGKPIERPLIVAGPCSAETEEQVLETARQLSKQHIDLFRVGIWKPRTRPNSPLSTFLHRQLPAIGPSP